MAIDDDIWPASLQLMQLEGKRTRSLGPPSRPDPKLRLAVSKTAFSEARARLGEPGVRCSYYPGADIISCIRSTENTHDEGISSVVPAAWARGPHECRS